MANRVDSNFKPVNFDVCTASSTSIPAQIQTPLPQPNLISPSLESVQTTPPPTVSTHSIEQIRQKTLPSSQTIPFQSFSIEVSEKKVTISTVEQQEQTACELSQFISDNHIQIRINLPGYGYGREYAAAKRFLEGLQLITAIISTSWKDLFYLIPKKTEEQKNEIIVRTYVNGIIEEVELPSKDNSWENWSGRRIFPSGKIESGSFSSFRFSRGIIVEEGVATYRFPAKILHSYGAKCALMYSSPTDKHLIAIQEKSNFTSYTQDWVQTNSTPISVLTKILENEHDIQDDKLKELLSGPINCKDFVQYLLETNAIFQLKHYPFRLLLQIIGQQHISINLHHQHPETRQTLLDCYSGDKKTIKTLLALNPSLIQRKEEMEHPCIRALLTNNKEGAALLFATMEKQNILLLPRELLFKKIAFSEGEISLADLQILSQQDQALVWQIGNIYSHLQTIHLMRSLQFDRKEELLKPEGPSIFGFNMDALEMHETLQRFLSHLRSQKLLLSKSEFKHLSKENYVKKNSEIDRILGRDYLENKARELRLKHVKVPKKIVVIDDHKNVKLRVEENLSITPSSETDLIVYAEKIKEADRKVTVEEVSELITLFDAAGFGDIQWSNLIIAHDGIYIIDTEFTNFWILPHFYANGCQYLAMEKIVHALPNKSQISLIDELNVKMSTYRANEHDLEVQKKNRRKAAQTAQQRTGCYYGPSFTFSAQELLDKPPSSL